MGIRLLLAILVLFGYEMVTSPVFAEQGNTLVILAGDAVLTKFDRGPEVQAVRARLVDANTGASVSTRRANVKVVSVRQRGRDVALVEIWANAKTGSGLYKLILLDRRGNQLGNASRSSLSPITVSVQPASDAADKNNRGNFAPILGTQGNVDPGKVLAFPDICWTPAPPAPPIPVPYPNIARSTNKTAAKPGTKVVKDPGCKQTRSLVCGQNGKTYQNRCFAEKAGVVIRHQGPCTGKIPMIPRERLIAPHRLQHN